MTREEAIFILKRDNPNNIAIRTGFESLYDQRKEGFSMAIKALEEESILDKVRVEIEKEIIPRNSDQYDHEAMWQNCGLRIALKVIYKYEAESEK